MDVYLQNHFLNNHLYKNCNLLEYNNLLIPKVGGMATALSAMPNINTLVDYTLVYKSKKRDVWSFAKGDMKHAKVLVTKYPENLVAEDRWGAVPLLYAIWAAVHPIEYEANFDIFAPLTTYNFTNAWLEWNLDTVACVAIASIPSLSDVRSRSS